jgi:hypothetical protein
LLPFGKLWWDFSPRLWYTYAWWQVLLQQVQLLCWNNCFSQSHFLILQYLLHSGQMGATEISRSSYFFFLGFPIRSCISTLVGLWMISEIQLLKLSGYKKFLISF